MGTINTCNVIIADTQFLVVETIKRLIGETGLYHLAGIAEAKQELIWLLEKTKNGLLITDPFSMDYDDAGDLKRIGEEYPQFKILVLTNFISKPDFQFLTRSGIKNIAYKNVDREDFFSAIQATLKGKKYYSGEIIDSYLDSVEKKSPIEENKQLTSSEIEIVRMIADGLSTKEIAVRKNISHHTVSTHRKNIFRKVEVSNASELIMCAIKAGWIDNIEYYI
jgi:DNA-binding NarL/FixJ family response regulator